MAEHTSFLIYKDWSNFVSFMTDENAGRLLILDNNEILSLEIKE